MIIFNCRQCPAYMFSAAEVTFAEELGQGTREWRWTDSAPLVRQLIGSWRWSTLEKNTRSPKCGTADQVFGCFSTNKERSRGRKKPSVLRELIPLVKSYCILFLSDPFENGNILNNNNLTHVAGSALFHCYMMYLCYWLLVCVVSLCVHVFV